MAAIFARPFYTPETSFAPLFRLLDDFESYPRQAQSQQQHCGRNRHGARRALFNRTLNPSFDVRETEDAYELHGELPGVDRENVQITFTEPQTIVIKGKVDRTYTAGTPPAAVADNASTGVTEDDYVDAAKDDDAITTASDVPRVATPSSERYAAVSDEETERAKERGEAVNEQPDATTANNKETTPAAPAVPKEKFWISERSVGEFSRNFSFPQRVDTGAVSARLENGILSVVIPKLKDQQPLRIAIN